MNIKSFTLRITFLLLLVLSNLSYAYLFNITPTTGYSLPTSVNLGSTATAYYTVANNTRSVRIGNFIKYLPPNVSQVTTGGTFPDTCGPIFNLNPSGTAGSSCTLQLTVSGPVNAFDPDPHHHLFACFPDRTSCAGTNFPLNVTLNPSPTPVIKEYFAYLTNTSDASIAICKINSDNSFSTCSLSTDPLLNTPQQVVINPAGTAAYVANAAGSDNILLCPIQADRTFAPCSSVVTGVASIPIGVGIDVSGSILFFSDAGGNTVYHCPINPDNTLGTCVSQAGFAAPTYMALTSSTSFNFVYVTETSQNMVRFCQNTAGVLTCANVGAGTFSSPKGIKLNAANSNAYVVNSNTPFSLDICAVNPVTGNFNSCSPQSLSQFFADVAFNPAQNGVYLISPASTVLFCNLNNGGTTLGTCTTLPSDPAFTSISFITTFGFVVS